jgi:hypothetical protein
MRASAQSRDVRLDVLRGLALLIIFVDHIPGMLFAGLTPQAFGYADAAEAFVLIAGLSAYQAYNGKLASAGVLRGSLPIFTRVWQLYVTHLALVVLVAGIAAYAARRFGDPNYLEALGLDVFLADPAQAIVGVVTLTFLPNYLDILPLYMIALSLLPLVLLGLRVHWAMPLALSLALYMVAQIWGLNLPNIQASRVWFFNPLAWQFIFVGGVVLAHLAATGRLETLFRLRGVVVFITTLASAYVLFSLLSVAPWRQIPALANLSLIDPADLPVADKTNLTVLRLVDGLAKAWLLAVLIPRAAAWLHALPARMLAVMGRQSLPVFVLGLVLSTVCGVILRETGFVLAVQIAVLVGGSAILIGFAALLDWQARMGRRDAAIAMTKADTEVRPAPGPSAPLAKALAEPSTQ